MRKISKWLGAAAVAFAALLMVACGEQPPQPTGPAGIQPPAGGAAQPKGSGKVEKEFRSRASATQPAQEGTTATPEKPAPSEGKTD